MESIGESVAEAVSELVLGYILALDRQIVLHAQGAALGIWAKGLFAPARGLRSLDVGVVGIGRVGAATCRLLSSVGCVIHALERSSLGENDERTRLLADVTAVVHPDLNDLAASVVALIVCASPSPGDDPLVGRDVLANLRAGGIVINVARSWAVDLDALRHRLDNGDLAAAFDVHPDEPPPGTNGLVFRSGLFSHPQVLSTPHIGASTIAAQRRSALLAAQLIESHFPGSGRTGTIPDLA